MGITYPPEMLPSSEEDEEAEVIVIDPVTGVQIPLTITLEICGKSFVLDPQAQDFDTRVNEVERRLRAWGVLCRAYTDEGATAAGLRNTVS